MHLSEHGSLLGRIWYVYLQDCFNRRSIVVIPMLVIAIPVLFGYSRKFSCHFSLSFISSNE